MSNNLIKNLFIKEVFIIKDLIFKILYVISKNRADYKSSMFEEQ